jgi:hypothetical protein
MRNAIKFWSMLAAFAIVWADKTMAEGALAVGITGDVAKDGYALGFNVNSATESEAQEGALDWCRTHPGQQYKVSALCKVINTFHHQCVAEANDPKPGTPGAGWAVAPDKESAEKLALTNCIATAGKDRKDACRVADSKCDTMP